jgi:hypothetical protein
MLSTDPFEVAASDSQPFVAGGDCQSAADLSVILTFRLGPKFVSVVGVVLRAVGARTFWGPHCWHTKKTEENDKAYLHEGCIDGCTPVRCI